MAKNHIEEKDLKGYSRPLYTRQEAKSLVITLGDGTTSTIGECSDSDFVHYIEDQVSKLIDSKHAHHVVRELLDAEFYRHKTYDEDARWYAINELPIVCREQQRLFAQRAYDRARKSKKTKRGAA